MKRLVSSLMLLAALWVPAAAQTTQAKLVSELEKVFEPWNRSDAPGGVVGIYKDGKPLFVRGYGLANMEHNVAMRPDTVIDIGSVSKQFTTACIYLLEEDGKLSVNDDVRKHIPELSMIDEEIQIHHLINHTSGIRDYFTLLSIKGWNVMNSVPREDVFDLLSKQRELNFKPGTSFNYCNTGYFLLSQIVERVSGKTLNEYATEKIFTPLGMSSTQFDDNNTTLIRGRANSYRKAGDEWFALMSSLELVGDGALHTTTSDMSKWHLALAGNTLSKTLTTKLQTKSTVAGKEFPYAGGLFIDKLSGLDRVQHGGDWLGFNAMASWFPDHKVSVFTFGNDGTQNGKSFNAEAAKLVLAEFITKEEPKAEEETVDEGFEMTDAQFKKLEGRYKLKLGGLVIKVFKDKGKFMAQATGQPSFELAAVSETSVKHSEADITMDFKSEKEGSFTEGTLTQNGMKIPFERLPAFEPTKEQIDALLGHYYSAELELTTEFYLEDGKLMADRNGKNGAEVAWIDENQLSSSGMTLDVKRDEKGRITHILVQAGRALNLRFDRLDI